MNRNLCISIASSNDVLALAALEAARQAADEAVALAHFALRAV